MKNIITILIILFPLVGCKTVTIDQRYFISSLLKDECLVSSHLRVNNYNHPFDVITEESETEIVNCENVSIEMTRQYELLGSLKIKLENKFK